MMQMEEILKVFAPHRGDAIVVSGRANRHWDKISTMTRTGTCRWAIRLWAAMLRLRWGLALAQPNKKVVLFDSEGDLQMSLGVLSMVAEQKPKNFRALRARQRMLRHHRRPTRAERQAPSPTMSSPRAAAIRHPTPTPISNRFTVNVKRIMEEAGPVFVAMKIVPEVENVPIGQRAPRLGKTKEQAVADLRKELGVNN